MTIHEFVKLMKSSTGPAAQVELTEEFAEIRRSLSSVAISRLSAKQLIVRKALLGSLMLRDWRLGRVDVEGLELRQVQVSDSAVEDLYFRTDSGFLIIKSGLERCNLDRVSSQYMLAVDSVFVNIEVLNLRHYGRAQLERCTFDGCKFRGRFAGGNFIACAFRDTDMSNVSFTDTSFLGCTGLPRLPSRRDNFVLEPKRFGEYIEEIQGRVSAMALQTFCEMARTLERYDGIAVIDVGFFDNMPSDDAKVIMERLFERRMVQES